MNFKTTIVLAILLVAGGLVAYFTHDRGGDTAEKSVQSQQKVFPNVNATDVTKLAIASAGGAKIAMNKTGANWQITEPVTASAEAFEVDALVRAITGIETTNIVTNASATGLDSPRYTVDLTAGGKDYTLLVGDKTAVGDSLYVTLKGKPDTMVIGADLLEKLAKPVSTYRNPKLVDIPINSIGTITINRPDGVKLVLVRGKDSWNITEPIAMPAEKSDVDDILFGLTGLHAIEWVAEDTKDAASYQLAPARYTATLTAMPTTLPTGVGAATTAPTSQPTSIVIKIGRYDDVMKKNIFVTTSQNPVIVKVGAPVLEQIDKKPLDLRDRKVVDVDSAQVSTITIASDLTATTKPTSRPASQKTVTIKRRHETIALGPTLSATKPATTPATTTTSTQPSIAPATMAATQPVTKWEVAAGDASKPGDDAKVDMLLSQLHPFRATKYIESNPTTQPTASYVVTIVSQAAGGDAAKTTELHLVDPGNSKPLVGTYNGLTFEVDRMIVDRLSGDFLKGSKPTPPAGGIGNEAPTGPPGTTFAP